MAQVAKIMLVEDDVNLSEIYQARMAAEGYQVITAHDGEEALALATKEKPDLIIADVMMPKISGFEMLDILRNTEGLKSTKVIMLTALGQAEDKTRAQSLGADRYLVKSQVTLEDIVKNAQALLNTEGMAGATSSPQSAATVPAASAPTSPPTAASNTPTITPAPVQAAPAAQPMSTPAVAMPPAVADNGNSALPPVQSSGQENDDIQKQIASFADTSAAVSPPQDSAMPPSAPESTPATTPPVTAVPPVSQPAQPPQSNPSVTDTNASNDALLSKAVNDLLKDATATPPVSTTAPAQVNPSGAPAVPPVAPVSVSAPSSLATPPASAPTPPAPAATTIPVATPPATDTSLGPAANAAKAPGDNTPVVHNKVIQPINDISKKPDLSTLLAAEEAKQPVPIVGSPTVSAASQSQVVQPVSVTAAADAQPVVHQPGNVVSPAEKNSTGIDPSSISL